jgi:Ca2+ transporting ATPase
MEDAFAKSADNVLANFKVDVATGLKADQVRANREKYGRNSTLATSPPPHGRHAMRRL